jgi:DNA-binding response OmpR family regulator
MSASTQTVLVVDDERKLREMLRVYFEQEGYRIVEAANGREALLIARREKPDIVILDLMMPELDGYGFMRLFTRESQTPVIILTAKVADTDKILGLELGADDYMTKPFNVRELLARLRAVLRRVGKAPGESEALHAADVTLDRMTATVTVGGREVDLTRSEFELLATLMASPGQIFSRLDLLDRVSGKPYDGYERAIDVHIRNLRAKIEPDSRNPAYIETIYGMGYRFTARWSGGEAVAGGSGLGKTGARS